MGLASPSYQTSVETKAAVADALKVSSSQPAMAAMDRPADGVGWARSDGVAFMTDIVAVADQKESWAEGKR